MRAHPSRSALAQVSALRAETERLIKLNQ
jgi:hypothetical protein